VTIQDWPSVSSVLDIYTLICRINLLIPSRYKKYRFFVFPDESITGVFVLCLSPADGRFIINGRVNDGTRITSLSPQKQLLVSVSGLCSIRGGVQSHFTCVESPRCKSVLFVWGKHWAPCPLYNTPFRRGPRDSLQPSIFKAKSCCIVAWHWSAYLFNEMSLFASYLFPPFSPYYVFYS
jgi:hypothetical protein